MTDEQLMEALASDAHDRMYRAFELLCEDTAHTTGDARAALREMVTDTEIFQSSWKSLLEHASDELGYWFIVEDEDDSPSQEPHDYQI